MTNHIDQDALGEHLEGVRRLVRTLVRSESEADDVVQDTMVAALESRTEVRGGLRAWLAGVARNMARRKARTEGRRSLYEGRADGKRTAPSTADVVARAAEQRRILDVILGMEEPYRAVLLLRFIEDLPPRKVAKRLDVPVETVRTQVRRGLIRLREQLDELHHGDRAELRAALSLAATEPLGAAHARAVALARASGLVVLLAAGALIAFLALGEDEGSEYPSHVADTPAADLAAADKPVAENDSTPSVALPGVPSSATETVPPVGPRPTPTALPLPPAAVPTEAGGPNAPAAVPAVKPIEFRPQPVPTEAIEDDVAKKKAAKKKAAKNAPAAAKQDKGAKSADDEAGSEFYEGETSFSAKQVDEAIDKGVAWLLKRQSTAQSGGSKSGSWGGLAFNAKYGGGAGAGEAMHAGPSALALYTLLKCKVPVKHDSVKRGFEWLSKEHRAPQTSYETSMLLLALTATADANKMTATSKNKKVKPKLRGRYRAWAAKTAAHLLDKREARGWRYNARTPDTTPGGPEDLSSTQLAALSLFAAHRLGIKTRTKVWEDILTFTLEQQMADGVEVVYRDPVDPTKQRTARARGFSYIRAAANPNESAPRGGMTACGIANLEMARYVLSAGGEKRDAWNKRKDAKQVQDAMFDGIAWLEKHWSPFEDPGAKEMNVYHIYYLYALERAMDLVALKRVGSHNWYSEMGQELLNRQQADGSWATRPGRGHDVLDTCFALLFLKRATSRQIPFGSITGGGDVPADNR